MGTAPTTDTAPATRLDRIRRRIDHFVFLVVWLFVMVLVAFGSAGVVAGIDHPPGTAARAELTWTYDRAIEPELEASTAQLRDLAVQLEKLGTLARGSLAAIAADKTDTLDQALADGTALLAQIDDTTQAMTSRLEQSPGIGPSQDLLLSATNQQVHALLLSGLESTAGLAANWSALTKGTVDATRLTGLLDEHDKLIVSAIDAGIDRKFKTAIKRIDAASDALDQATKIRDTLRARTDVATLSEWLRRNKNYDTALRRLYVVSSKSPTKVTQALRSALAAEKRARSELPRDTSGLVIIVSDISRAGLNQTVTAIERARTKLGDAIDGIDELFAESPTH
jgi:hypothetical protein